MMAKTLALSTVMFLLGTGCAPRVRFEVPDGWKIRRTIGVKTGASGNVMVPNSGGPAWINVVCAPIDDGTPTQAYLNIKESLEDEGAEITEVTANFDWTQIEIFFATETEDGSMMGRALVKLDSAGHRYLLNVQGIWPADQEEDLGPIFEAVAASADFR